MNKAIITGGCGFIGSTLANYLDESGWDVVIIDDLSSGELSLLDKSLFKKVVTVDFASKEAKKVIKEYQPDVLFHFAAKARVKLSIDKPVMTTDDNLMKTVRLFDDCRSVVPKIIFSSSSSVYGLVDESSLPVKIEHPKKPISPYALQKSFIEDYAKMCFDYYDQDITCLRFFNVYGPKQLANGAYSTIIPAWMRAALSDKNEKLIIYGDGTQTRDMVFVNDVIDACVNAYYASNIGGKCFNISGGHSISVNSIKEWFMDEFSLDNDDFVYKDPRAGDIKHTLADLTLSRKYLNYEPKTSMSYGLTWTHSWWMQK